MAQFHAEDDAVVAVEAWLGGAEDVLDEARAARHFAGRRRSIGGGASAGVPGLERGRGADRQAEPEAALMLAAVPAVKISSARLPTMKSREKREKRSKARLAKM